MAVDLWGEFRDVAAETPWDEERMLLMFSTSNGMAATAMALAHFRGLFERNANPGQRRPPTQPVTNPIRIQ